MTPTPMSCDAADELAGAVAFDALDAVDLRPLEAHLATCREPHVELRNALGAGQVLEMALEPVEPSPALRARIMTSLAAEAESRRPSYRSASPARPRWLLGGAVGLAAVLMVVLVGWNVLLQARLAERQAEVQRVAAALSGGGTIQPVSGTAGGGVLVDGPDGPVFVASVAPLGAGRIYEMWLIDDAGVPAAVGTFTVAGDDLLVVVQLERPLEGFSVFAVTVEQSRVESPTTEPVLVGPLG